MLSLGAFFGELGEEEVMVALSAWMISAARVEPEIARTELLALKARLYSWWSARVRRVERVEPGNWVPGGGKEALWTVATLRRSNTVVESC